jgi:large subunit ribosomal protein L20
MPRVKNRVASRAKRKKVLTATSGYYGKRSNCYSVAKDSFLHAGVYAYRDRKQKKRHFHSLWITRINAAARLNGLPYAKFMSGLKSKGIDIDRKMLAHLALHEPDTFKSLVESVKA